jgi:hypothetical protein
MPDLNFRVAGAEPVSFAATPTMSLKVLVTNSPPSEEIHSVVLQVQIQIEASQRRYSEGERAKLVDLFGAPGRWSLTLRSMPWTHASTVLSSFTQRTLADLHVPCTFDFNIAATNYFHAVEEGDIPLTLLFSGTIFYAASTGALQVAPISWNKLARYRLKALVWRRMMDEYYPNSAWLTIRRDVFDRMLEFKVRHGIATWEDMAEHCLELMDGDPVHR